jgi:hypothetical protein
METSGERYELRDPILRHPQQEPDLMSLNNSKIKANANLIIPKDGRQKISERERRFISIPRMSKAIPRSLIHEG